MSDSAATGGAVAIAWAVVRIVETALAKLSPSKKDAQPDGCAECRNNTASLRAELADMRVSMARIEERIKALQ